MTQHEHAKSLNVAKTIVIEWYDGLVAGIVESGRQPEYLLCLLVAWSLESDTRVYAVVPVTNEFAGSIERLMAAPVDETKWGQVLALLAEVTRNLARSVAVVACDNIRETIYSEVRMSPEQIAELGAHERRTGRTLSDSQLRVWLDRLQVPYAPAEDESR